MLLPERARKQSSTVINIDWSVVGPTTQRPAEQVGRCFLAVTIDKTIMNAGFQCAGCGEWNETSVDSSAGTRQEYVEDCQICCKPNILHLSWDMLAAEYTISAELE